MTSKWLCDRSVTRRCAMG